MPRIRTLLVGRDAGCDVWLDDPSVSRRHAEVVRLPDGLLHVTDRATMNGTFVLDGDGWRAIRQAFLEPAGRIRFGELELSAGRLAALCPPAGGGAAGGGAGRPAQADRDELDPSKGLVRDPETGELLERESPGRGRRPR